MSFSEVLRMIGLGKRDVAATLLKEEFGKLQSPEQRVELCKWIAVCFEGLADYSSAGEWYEMAGILSVGETSSEAANALRALPELEKARACYAQCEDDDKAENCDSLMRHLSKCFVAS
jgi:hypothetical protein